MVYNSFDKKSAKGGNVNNETKLNGQLAEELHKRIIKKIEKEEIFSHLKTIYAVLI